MQQQITDLQDENKILIQQMLILNETIVNLQNRLNSAEENQQELLLDLTTAKGQLDSLKTDIYGKSEAIKEGQSVSYSNSGIKFFDFTILDAYFNLNLKTHGLNVSLISHIDGMQLNSKVLNISAFLYSVDEQKTYSNYEISSNDTITFELNVPDNLLSGLVYLYAGNTLFAVYDVSFDEIAI